MTRLIDLSHTIEADMTTYPGLPGPMIAEHLSRSDSTDHYEAGTEFLIGRIDMVGNTGTYLDTPFHRYEDGFDLDALALGDVADLPGVVVDAAGPELEPDAIEGVEVGGRAVHFHTGWDRHWRTEAYVQGHPYLTAEAAQHLVDAGAALVGIDSLNIDDPLDRARPVHSGLLSAGIPICEHLTNLGEVPIEGAWFSAIPAPVRGTGTFPVRAVASIPI